MAARFPGFVPPDDLPFAHGRPGLSAMLRERPEDFEVEEELGFDLDGEGTHAWIRVRKRGANTQWVADALGRLAGARPVDVGYAGMKDRSAVTTQWFSVNLAGRPEPDWSSLDSEQVEVVAVFRHRRKLRRGAHRRNRFRLTLRHFEGERAELAARIEATAKSGVPNYFGAQRFGRGYRNVDRAAAMLAGGLRPRPRFERGLYLSAARALLFNRVLAERVTGRVWDRHVPGDVMMRDGGRGRFRPAAADPLADRIAQQAIHPSGPLWGSGDRLVAEQALAIEDSALAECGEWRVGLERAGLESDRRALRLRLEDPWVDDGEAGTVRLGFSLPRGSYATVALRELVQSRLSST